MHKFRVALYWSLCFIIGFCSSCSERHDAKTEITPIDEQVIGLSIDMELKKAWRADSTAKILEPEDYPQAYQYMRQIEQAVVNSPYLNESLTSIQIIDDTNGEKTAFVAPGGYIYIYKDLLNTLSSESQFVGLLSCLMACSESKKPTDKLVSRFSINYMLDLAIGGKLDNIELVHNELCEVPYDSLWVNTYDEKSIGTLCHSGYDIQDYSDLFSLHPNLTWMELFPRKRTYATTLFNIKDATTCSGDLANINAYQSMLATLPQ
jgi:hypothetical protein